MFCITSVDLIFKSSTAITSTSGSSKAMISTSESSTKLYLGT